VTAAESRALIGKTLTIRDKRTGAKYTIKVKDVKEAYGNLRVQVAEVWFEPTDDELKTAS
jgi:hypothetical protein